MSELNGLHNHWLDFKLQFHNLRLHTCRRRLGWKIIDSNLCLRFLRVLNSKKCKSFWHKSIFKFLFLRIYRSSQFSIFSSRLYLKCIRWQRKICLQNHWFCSSHEKLDGLELALRLKFLKMSKIKLKFFHSNRFDFCNQGRNQNQLLQRKELV